MGGSPSNGPESVTARFALRMPGGTLQAEMTVPTGPTRVDGILPMAQTLSDNLISLTLTVIEAEGRMVTCRAGCGAGCRQLVPLAEAEARHIRDLVEAMPEPRRSLVRSRFTEALRRFGEAGLLETLRRTDILDKERNCQVGLEYFRRHVACPFLEDESCSIHPDRPIACREYLVTSPPNIAPSRRGMWRGLVADARLDGRRPLRPAAPGGDLDSLGPPDPRPRMGRGPS